MHAKFADRDVICAVALILFAAASWSQVVMLPDRAALFPRLDIALLFAVSLVYLLRSIWRTGKGKPVKPFFKNAGRFVIALVLIGLYVLIFPVAGFFTTTFIFVPIFAVAIGLRRVTGVILASAVFTLGAWLVFVVLLGRRLPPEALISLVERGAS